MEVFPDKISAGGHTMEIYGDPRGLRLQGTALALGKFDGIHRGHRRLLEEVLRQEERGLIPSVFCFDRSPASVLFGEREQELTTNREKMEAFLRMGVKRLILFPMTRETAAIPAAQFLEEILGRALDVSFVAAGPDLRFGDRAGGDVRMLEDWLSGRGGELRVIPKVMEGGEAISSTRVREAVRKGDMALAAALLGEPYAFFGTVRQGHQLGRRLGFPTLNLEPEGAKLLPPFGVYGTQLRFEEEGEAMPAVTNIGVRPTVDGSGTRVTVETHVLTPLPFEGEGYGKTVTCQLMWYQRPEIRFDSPEALADRIRKDKEEALARFGLS